MRICAYAPTRIVIFILLITYITTRFFEKNFLREKMIFLRKNYFRKGLKLCAHAHMRMVTPPYTIFSFPYFFPAGDFRCSVGFLLFGGSLRVVLVRFVLCFLRCFFWVFVCCFLIPGLYGSLFGDSDLFCGICLMLAKMTECQCESAQNEGVLGVMSGIFGWN